MGRGHRRSGRRPAGHQPADATGPLLDALAADFRKNGYDLKKLIRTIATRHVYGLSLAAERPQRGRHCATTRGTTASGCGPRCCSTRSATSPACRRRSRRCRRARGRWSSGRPASQSLFLDSFGRPDPNQDPPCERTTDTTVVQALHLMNSPEPAPQGDERRRPLRDAGGEQEVAGGDRRRAVPAGVLPLPDRRLNAPTAVKLFAEAGRDSPQRDRRPAVGADEHAGVRVQGLRVVSRERGRLGRVQCRHAAETAAIPRWSPIRDEDGRSLVRHSHATHTNCAGVTRRDCLQLGLGALLGGGLAARAAASRLGGGRRQPACQGQELHPDLDGRRADALRDVRPQAGRPGGDPRRVQAHPDRSARRPLLRAHDAAGAASPTSSRSSARSATTRATTAPATTT